MSVWPRTPKSTLPCTRIDRTSQRYPRRRLGHSRTPMIAALAFLAAGCAGDDTSPVPAAVYDCFKGGGIPEGAIPEGLIELGTGRDQFELLTPEQDLHLVLGIQGGFHMEVRTRLQGLYGGKAGSTDPDHAPRTMLTAFNESGEQIDHNYECGFSFAYAAAEEEYDVSPTVRLILFGVDPPAIGERIRIVAEIVDQDGNYASNEVWVVTAE